jgi:hypothetical protein
MSNYYNEYCIGFSYKSLSYRYSKKDLFEICKKLNISKISSKNKTQLIDIIDININNKIKILSKELNEKIKYAKIIFNFVRRLKYSKVGDYKYSIGLGKWLVIVNCKDNPDSNSDYINSDWGRLCKDLRFLDNIIGVTGWKWWKDHSYSDISNTACICIYCGISEKILEPNKQYKWITHIGNKLSKIEYIKNISIRDKIYFKENFKTRQGIYSQTHPNVCPLYIKL